VPIAITQSPTRIASELPSTTFGMFLGASVNSMIAMSV
jgi:hypothetical protein